MLVFLPQLGSYPAYGIIIKALNKKIGSIDVSPGVLLKVTAELTYLSGSSDAASDTASPLYWTLRLDKDAELLESAPGICF